MTSGLENCRLEISCSRFTCTSSALLIRARAIIGTQIRFRIIISLLRINFDALIRINFYGRIRIILGSLDTHFLWPSDPENKIRIIFDAQMQIRIITLAIFPIFWNASALIFSLGPGSSLILLGYGSALDTCYNLGNITRTNLSVERIDRRLVGFVIFVVIMSKPAIDSFLCTSLLCSHKTNIYTEK